MQALSDTLEAMKLNEATPKAPQHGSTMTAGPSNTQLAIQERKQDLTEDQLTQISSSVLAAPFTMTLSKRNKLGRQMIEGQWVDGCVVGEESVLEIDVRFVANPPVAMLNAALALSPSTACLKHLMHLALHKRVGTDQKQLTILLADYISALSGFPEFVIWQVCSHYWTNDPRPFLPFIAEMKDACEALTLRLQSIKSRLVRIAAEPPRKLSRAEILAGMHHKELDRDEWLPCHWEQWVAEARQMATMFRADGKTASAEEWDGIAARRAETQEARHAVGG